MRESEKAEGKRGNGAKAGKEAGRRHRQLKAQRFQSGPVGGEAEAPGLKRRGAGGAFQSGVGGEVGGPV